MHRFLKAGNASAMVGQEGIPAVYSPMTRTLEDLETFWRAVVSMKPWEYDPFRMLAFVRESRMEPFADNRYYSAFRYPGER